MSLPILKERFLFSKNWWLEKMRRIGIEGFQYGQISVFDKKEDLMTYDKHPEHQKFVRRNYS